MQMTSNDSIYSWFASRVTIAKKQFHQALPVLQHFSNPISGLSTCTSGRAGYANLGITALHARTITASLQWSSWCSKTYSMMTLSMWACWLPFAHSAVDVSIHLHTILNLDIETNKNKLILGTSERMGCTTNISITVTIKQRGSMVGDYIFSIESKGFCRDQSNGPLQRDSCLGMGDHHAKKRSYIPSDLMDHRVRELIRDIW